jgi:hypothetical protein
MVVRRRIWQVQFPPRADVNVFLRESLLMIRPTNSRGRPLYRLGSCWMHLQGMRGLRRKSSRALVTTTCAVRVVGKGALPGEHSNAVRARLEGFLKPSPTSATCSIP